MAPRMRRIGLERTDAEPYSRPMPWETATLKRHELYEQVWTTPMRVLAKRYGVSDVALAKICKALGVPRPGRGYWMRKAAGKPVKQIPLPPPQPGMPLERRLSRWHDSLCDEEIGDEVQALLERESDPSMTIDVPNELHRPHPLVRESAGNLRKHSKNHLAARLEKACLDIRATRATLDRALLVCDTLIKALEKRGFRVEVTAPVPPTGGHYGPASQGKPSITGVHILESFVQFYIEEGHDVIWPEGRPPRPRPFDPSAPWDYTPRPKPRHEPNGRLGLVIDRHWLGATRGSWRDGKRQKVENCLHAVVVEMVRVAVRERLDRLEKERLAREREREVARREAAERRRRQEQAWIADLTQRVSVWHQGNEILKFVDHFEDAGRNDSLDRTDQDQRREWARSARAYAVKLLEGSVRDPEIPCPPPDGQAVAEPPVGAGDRRGVDAG